MSQRARQGDVIVLTVGPNVDQSVVASIREQAAVLEQETGIKTLVVGGGVTPLVARRALDEDVERALDVLDRFVKLADERVLETCQKCHRSVALDEPTLHVRLTDLIVQGQQALAAVELADAGTWPDADIKAAPPAPCRCRANGADPTQEGLRCINASPDGCRLELALTETSS